MSNAKDECSYDCLWYLEYNKILGVRIYVITTKVSEYIYDLGIIGQGQMNLKSVFTARNANSSFIF